MEQAPSVQPAPAPAVQVATSPYWPPINLGDEKKLGLREAGLITAAIVVAGVILKGLRIL
jgi:hypothetical protein